MITFWILAFGLALACAGYIGWPIVSKESGGDPSAASPARATRMAALAALGLTPLLAAFLYLEIGAPEALKMAPNQTAAAQPEQLAANNAAAISAMPENQRQAMIETMVARLAEKLGRAPDDLEGWRMLARSYAVLGRQVQSAGAWREAVTRSNNNIDDLRGLATALLEAAPENDETINEDLGAVLEQLLTADQHDPLALYFLGHAAAQQSDFARAAALWTRLKQTLPPDAPLAPNLTGLIEKAQNDASAAP